MIPTFIIQWQTKEYYIGQCWTLDVYETSRIVGEERDKNHLSLQVFLVSKDCEIKEMEVYYEQ